MAEHVRERLLEVLPEWLDTDLVVIDVGARWGAGERWRRFAPKVRVVGFDPDEEECARLNAAESGDGAVRYVPAALAAEAGSSTLHVTADPACSSLYPPIPELVEQRPELAVTAPVGTTSVTTTTLDAWLAGSDLDRVDVVKLDTQGSELGVLRGAPLALATVRILEVEVEFNEVYAGQPLFGDVDRYLRSRGFVLWRLQNLVHYGLPDVASDGVAVPDTAYFDSRPAPVAGEGGQLFWGHAYFVPRPLALPAAGTDGDWSQALRDACGAVAFGFTDLALSVLGRAAAGASPAQRAEVERLLALTAPTPTG